MDDYYTMSPGAALDQLETVPDNAVRRACEIAREYEGEVGRLRAALDLLQTVVPFAHQTYREYAQAVVAVIRRQEERLKLADELAEVCNNIKFVSPLAPLVDALSAYRAAQPKED